MKKTFRQPISGRDQGLVAGLTGQEALKDVRVIERYVFVLDRTDGSQVILDASAVIRIHGNLRTAGLIILHGTRTASRARKMNEKGNYCYTTKDARSYCLRSLSEESFKTSHTKAHAKKLGEQWASTATLTRLARSHLQAYAKDLRARDFALVKLGRRSLKWDENLKWYGVNRNWRIPQSKIVRYIAEKARAKALANRNNWIKKDIKTVREVV